MALATLGQSALGMARQATWLLAGGPWQAFGVARQAWRGRGETCGQQALQASSEAAQVLSGTASQSQAAVS